MTGQRDELDLFAGIPDFVPQNGDDGAAGVEHLPAPPQIASVPAPTRQQHRRRIAGAVAAAFAWQAIWLVAFEHRGDLGAVPAARLALGVFIPLSAAALAWTAAVRRGDRGLGARRTWLVEAIVSAALLFGIATWIVAPADHAPSAGAFLDRAVRCMGVTAILWAPSLAALAFAFRRAFVATSTWRTAALGLACGALAAATMSLVCPHDEAAHVLLGHGAFLVVGAIAGALLGKRATRV